MLIDPPQSFSRTKNLSTLPPNPTPAPNSTPALPAAPPSNPTHPASLLQAPAPPPSPFRRTISPNTATPNGLERKQKMTKPSTFHNHLIPTNPLPPHPRPLRLRLRQHSLPLPSSPAQEQARPKSPSRYPREGVWRQRQPHQEG